MWPLPNDIAPNSRSIRIVSVYRLRLGRLFLNSSSAYFVFDFFAFDPSYLPTSLRHGAWRGIDLLNSGDEWHRTIEEAVEFQTGNQLQLLFVCILLNCPADPLKLCDDHQLHLWDDCSYLLTIKYDIENPSNDQIKSLALSFIRDLLKKNNSDLDQHHLPPPVHEFEPVLHTLANQIVAISDGTTAINNMIQWHTESILANNSIQSFADVVFSGSFLPK